jgi:hypothetical protein
VLSQERELIERISQADQERRKLVYGQSELIFGLETVGPAEEGEGGLETVPEFM